MAQIVFMIVAAFGLGSALGTVLARNLVHAALYLIAFFFAVACLFVMLEAEFLAVVQVLVYIGAVAILLMFGIMLTRNVLGDDTTTIPAAWKAPGLFAGFCLFVVLVFGINSAVSPDRVGVWASSTNRPSIAPAQGVEPAWIAERREAINDMPRMLGYEIMTRYALAFETAGLLLTAALVGAIALAHREEEDPRPDRAPGAPALAESRNGPRPTGAAPAPAPAATASKS